MGSDNSLHSNPPKVGLSIRHAPTIGASRSNACQHGRMSLADETKCHYHDNATDHADVVVVVMGGQGSRYAYNTGSQITTETACHGQSLDDSNLLAMDRTRWFSTTFSDHPADAVQCKHGYDNQKVADWLSRDPIGEMGFQTVSGKRNGHIRDGNLYCFVGNSPLTKFDLLGLTDKDVQTIINAFLSTMKTMCGDGRCCPEEGWRQNVYSWFTKREGCTQQSIDLFVAMYPLTQGVLDDRWLADNPQDTIIPPLFYHNYVTMTPLAPQPAGPDGYIVDKIAVDTWKGCYTITQKKMISIEPDPQQSFWLWKDETKCFTCKDLKAGAGK